MENIKCLNLSDKLVPSSLLPIFKKYGLLLIEPDLETREEIRELLEFKTFEDTFGMDARALRLVELSRDFGCDAMFIDKVDFFIAHLVGLARKIPLKIIVPFISGSDNNCDRLIFL